MNSQGMYEINKKCRELANKYRKNVAFLKDKEGKKKFVFLESKPEKGELSFNDWQKYPDHILLAYAFPCIPGYNKINPETGRRYLSEKDYQKDCERIKSAKDISKNINDRFMSKIKQEIDSFKRRK